MLLMFLSVLVLSVVGVPLMKMQDSGLINDILSSKNDHKALLNIISEADPAKLDAVVVLVLDLLKVSKSELEQLTTNSDNADAAYSSAVISHDAAVGAQTTGLVDLKTTYDQGVATLKAVVDAAKKVKDSTSATKDTANGVLAAEKTRLDSEITSLGDIISLIKGINPRSAPVFTLSSPNKISSAACFTGCNGNVAVPQSVEETNAMRLVAGATDSDKIWLGIKKAKALESSPRNLDAEWKRNDLPYTGWTNWYGTNEGNTGELYAGIIFSGNWDGQWYDVDTGVNYCICQDLLSSLN